MAEAEQIMLLTLNTDVLGLIFGLLDLESLGRLAQTCSAMRDLIYGSALWRDTILCSGDISQLTAASIKQRNINTLSLGGLCLPGDVAAIDASETLNTLIVSGGIDVGNFDGNKDSVSLKGLDCLIALHVTTDSDEGYAERVLLEENLMYVLPAFSNIRELHLYELKGDDANMSAKLVNHMAYDLPRMKHLEFKETFNFSNRQEGSGLWILSSEEIYDEPSLAYMPDGGFCGLERLAGVRLNIDDVCQMSTLFANLPSLKHLRIGYHSTFDLSYQTEEERNDEAHKFKSLESLEMGLPTDCREHVSLFLECLPNLKALELYCDKTFYRSDAFDDPLHALVKVSPKLIVLKISNMREPISETFMYMILTKLHSLQVLVLTPLPDHNDLLIPSKDLVKDILKSGREITSVIGVCIDGRFDTMTSLMFKSSATNLGHVLMKEDTGKWRRISRYTACWNEAHGTRYFYPQESIPNIKVTEHVKKHFIDKDYHLCADGGSRKHWRDMLARLRTK